MYCIGERGLAVDIRQALVLVGGKASRLRAGAVEVPLSKAFMPVAGRPLLYWNLYSLHQAGIRRLVIVADRTALLHEASKVIKELSCKFERIAYFQDEGNGVHGVPYELRYLLDENYIFECGHSISRPDHYERLAKAKNDDDVVFSAYKSHPKNRRQPVSLKNGKVYSTPDANHAAIAHPIVTDREYARHLLVLKFNITEIISYYSQKSKLNYVRNNMPPEYDIIEEMSEAHIVYEHYIARLAIM